jgi:hypothetical protein
MQSRIIGLAWWQKLGLVVLILFVLVLVIGYILSVTYEAHSGGGLVPHAEGTSCPPTTMLTLTASTSSGPASGDLVASDCTIEHFTIQTTGSSSAIGPNIAVGTPSLVNGKINVPILTTGTILNPYNGINIHLRWDPAVFSFSSASASGSVISGSSLCPSAVDSDGGGLVYSCVSVTGASTTVSGLIATMLLTPTVGCSALHLFTFAGANGGSSTTGTYTINAADTQPQSNTYTDGTAGVNGQTCTPSMAAQTASAGPQACAWSLTSTNAGVETDTFTVLQAFTLQPFSNITDWANPPYMTHDFTGAGNVLYSDMGTSGTTYPWATFSPGIYSQIAVNAQSGIKYPRIGLPLFQVAYHLDAHVTSPGYVPSTDLCTSTWTITKTSLVDPIVDPIINGIKDCGAWLECFWTGFF